ncbi:MAG: hypothetical protein HRU09_14880 [Oligoflexales bacterium]|nr:hypothetical protein [Oligoflexales bacterium]
MESSRQIFIPLLLFLASLLPGGLKAQNNHELNLLTSDKQRSYHPLEVALSEVTYPFYLAHNPLFSLDRENKWVCRLCKEFPSLNNGLLEALGSSNNSYDLKISFEFSPDFMWGDGKPINGYDLYFTWQVSSKLEHRYLGKHFFNRIQQISVDSNDPRKVTVYLRGKTSLYSDWGEVTLIPRHLEKKIWLKYRDRPHSYFRHSLYHSEPFNPGLYSGYYYLSSEQTFKRSRNLLQSKAAYDAIKLVKPSKFSNFRNKGEFLTPESLPRDYASILRQAEVSSHPQKEVWGDSIVFEHVSFNLRNPILKDKRIRWALSHGFDKNALIKLVHQNLVSPTAHFLAPQHQGFNKDIPLYPFDPKKSSKLLDDAEWVLDPKTQLRYKMGKPLRLSLTTNSDPQRVATAKFLAESWKQIGVQLDIKYLKNSHFWNSIKRKAFDSMIMFAWELPADRSFYPLFSSNAVPNIRNQYQGQNICGWINKRVDRILTNLKNEFSHERRNAHLKDLQKIFAEEVPMIPLFMPNLVASVPRGLEHFYISGNQFPSSHYVHRWAHKQKSKISIK